MRSFTLSLVSLVLLFFVAGCSKNNIQISQQQKNLSAVEKSTTADNCVTYDFSDMTNGQYYSSWDGVTFKSAYHNSVLGAWSLGWECPSPVVIQFPGPYVYNKVSISGPPEVYSLGSLEQLIVTYSDGSTFSYNRLANNYPYPPLTLIAPYGKFIKSVGIVAFGQQIEVSAIKLYKVDNRTLTFDFTHLDSGDIYTYYQGLTFFRRYSWSGPRWMFWMIKTNITGCWENGGFPTEVVFPGPSSYNNLSIDLACSAPKFIVTVNGTKGGTRTFKFSSDGSRNSYTVTAPFGENIASMWISTENSDGWKMYSMELYHQCPAPEINSLKASPSELWPANNKETEVIFSGNVDNKCGSTTYKLTDEYGDYSYTGTIASGDFSIPLELMASRKGNDTDGRTYTFTVTSENAAGKVVKSVDVVVPHDQRKK